MKIQWTISSWIACTINSSLSSSTYNGIRFFPLYNTRLMADGKSGYVTLQLVLDVKPLISIEQK